jgi:hypothetical protein
MNGRRGILWGRKIFEGINLPISCKTASLFAIWRSAFHALKKRGEQAEEKAEYPKALFATPAASNPRAQDLPPLRPRAFARALPLER